MLTSHSFLQKRMECDRPQILSAKPANKPLDINARSASN
uniref:Uncharacterized protein n=1 Tax=Nelumbo nucifera TaxID=4432 RepID=A0A822XXI9_NELNU|nr:TPA_asm: hypothetical protein HUJ06_026196 [Nelumbo nucifera]